MILSNLHTHTHFCDGKDSPAAMAQAAAELGFVSLGFSGHGIWPWCDVNMTPENQPRYRQEVLALKALYAGRMDILLGVEHDGGQVYDDLDWDFMIESVHDLPFEGEFRSIDWDPPRTDALIAEFCGGDAYKLARLYFEFCAACYSRSPAQIAGHVDLIAKFNEGGRLFDETDPRYLNPAMEAVDAAIDRGLVVEVNTGAMAKGWRTTPYPGPALLKRLKERNAPIMLNSDCHDRNFLTHGFAQSIELLKAMGFDHTLILTAKGWQEAGLD
jgi:histidinol-phosphatase (PHP family)